MDSHQYQRGRAAGQRAARAGRDRSRLDPFWHPDYALGYAFGVARVKRAAAADLIAAACARIAAG